MTIRKTIENVALGAAYGSSALAAIVWSLPEIKHFDNPFYTLLGIGAAGAGTYLFSRASDPEPRFNDSNQKPEYQSKLEGPGLKFYDPEGK